MAVERYYLARAFLHLRTQGWGQHYQGSIEGFTQALDNVFTEIDLSKVEIYLIGDMNIDMSDKHHIACKKIIDLTQPIGVRQLIKQPTRYSSTRNSILDVCFTNSDL